MYGADGDGVDTPRPAERTTTGSRVVAVHTPCFRRRFFVRVRVRALLLEVLAGEVRGPIAVLDRAGEMDRRSQGAPSPRAATTPAGNETGQLWVDERSGG